MSIHARITALHPQMTEWRRQLHMRPGLSYDVGEAAAFVAERLREFGVDEVVEGIGGTGVVGVIRGRHPGNRAIGLRADMDALPILETPGKPWTSQIPGKMHACGHDGHTATLLGAARVLAETRDFSGSVVLVFQPAEEDGNGAKAMVDDGLIERFGIGGIYGMHNAPGMRVGEFAIRPGPMQASCDKVRIEIEGVGGHAAMPQLCRDPVLAGSAMVMAAQQLVSRNVDPMLSAVVSLTCFHAGATENVIPQTAMLRGTVRTLDPKVRDLIETRLEQIVHATAQAYGVTAVLTYERECPVLVNHPRETEIAVAAARDVSSEVDPDCSPEMGAEDFAFMLEACPGAYIYTGNGDTANLHNPDYDFNDAALAPGAAFWLRLVAHALPPVPAGG